MERKFDIVINSEKEKDRSCFQIASGFISETNILFEKENIVASIHAEGRIEFYDMNGELLAARKLPPVENGKKVYEEVCCQAEGDKIVLQFPIYEWIDNYPNCDGEYDRWETRRIGYQTLTFDRTSNRII